MKMFFFLRIEAFILYVTLCIDFSQCALERERAIAKENLDTILNDLEKTAQNVLDDPSLLEDFSQKAIAAYQKLDLAAEKSGNRKQMSDCFEKHYGPSLNSWGKAATQGMDKCSAATLTDLQQFKKSLQSSSQKLGKAAETLQGITTVCYSKKLKTNHESLLCLKNYRKTANGFIKLFRELIADVHKATSFYLQSETSGRNCVQKVLKTTGTDFFSSIDTVEKCFNKR